MIKSSTKPYNDPVFEIPQAAADRISVIAHRRADRMGYDDESIAYREAVEGIKQEMSEAWAKRNPREREQLEHVNAITITPAMRRSVMQEGQPLFQVGAGIGGAGLAYEASKPEPQTDEEALVAAR